MWSFNIHPVIRDSVPVRCRDGYWQALRREGRECRSLRQAAPNQYVQAIQIRNCISGVYFTKTTVGNMDRRSFLLRHHSRREMSVSQDQSEPCHVD